MRIARAVVFSLVSAVAISAADSSAPLPGESIEGEWKVVKFDTAGGSSVANYLIGKVVIIRDGEVRPEEEKNGPSDVTYKLHLKSNPKGIDITSKGMTLNKQLIKFLGIYKVEKGVLTIILAFPGNKRPARFGEKSDSKETAIIALKRIKK